MNEKFKKHAMYQTQIENDNQKLIYEVELLKDIIEEHDELIVELRRQFKDKSRVQDLCSQQTKQRVAKNNFLICVRLGIGFRETLEKGPTNRFQPTERDSQAT
jgi:hypothetical protein